jgi:hypothetical protein
VVVAQLAGSQAVDGVCGWHNAVGPLPVVRDGVVGDGEAWRYECECGESSIVRYENVSRVGGSQV